MKSMRTKNVYKHLNERQLGLSLIELMVALALGLIIVAALAQLFVNISRTNQEMAKTNSQIENARFVMQFLHDDVVHAGFWGAHVPEFDDLSLLRPPTDSPIGVPDPCKAYAEWDEPGDGDYTDYRNMLFGISIEVHGGAPGTCGVIIEDQVANTDILVVRHANTCEPGVGNCDDTGTAGQLYFQASLCNDDLDPYSLDPNSPLLDRQCTAPAPQRKFVQSIYYIRSWSSDDPVEDGIPTLVRSTFELNGGTLAQQPAVPLVEGIERFRVEVGIDSLSEPYTGFPDGTAADPNSRIEWLDPDLWDTATNRGDGIPDGAFVHCPTSGCSAYDLLNVVAVKLHILARANEPSPGYTDTKTYTLGTSAALPAFNDGFKRHVFSTTVRLNNISGRRETP